jgi:hypothetical protein
MPVTSFDIMLEWELTPAVSRLCTLMEYFFHSMKAKGVHGRTFPDQQRLDY